MALVGPGQFAREVHLKNLSALGPAVRLRAVVGRDGASARETARRFAAAYATTDLEQVLRDTGHKLTHLDGQLITPDALDYDLRGTHLTEDQSHHA